MLHKKPPKRARLALALLAAASVGTAGLLIPDAMTPEATAGDLPPDDFYTPPGSAPTGKPGDVIDSREVEPGTPTARKLAKTWQVKYVSKDANGKPVALTGTVMVPREGDPAKAPIVGWGPGTQGPAFRCTPSRMIAKGALYEQWVVNKMLKAGYAVAIPDYQGYHAKPKTTYMTGKSLGPALIDAVRAAQKLRGSGLSADAKVAFRGYSQGGGAAMWAGEFKADYAPEMNLTGIVAGGVPADMVDMALNLNGQPGSGFLFYGLVGLDNAYAELDLASAMNDKGKALLADYADKVCAVELINNYGNQNINNLTTKNPLADEKWVARYTENSLGSDTKIKVPVFQYHATKDALVPPGQAERLQQSYCEQGVKLSWKAYDTGKYKPVHDHLRLIQAADDAGMEYLAARFAGKPADSTC
ncbi:lipase family protein [Streptomyces monticola]|uniref:Lipase family protein n=1 Tax=Streptomyces monticola TaxID=2666263 RepID=A0ABW2JBY0_9ACTN